MAIIGIDLGTTNSLAAVWQNGQSVLIPNPLGGMLTPSAISIDEDGSILVGQAAHDRLVSHPERSATSFKRFMGTDKLYNLAGKTFTPEDLSSLVLRRLREDAEAYLGQPVTEAIISVPAYFNDSQRSATKRAGALAGLTVERLINEPSAAALACHLEDLDSDNTFLVFDFGGGTLDISIVDSFENVVSITAVCGDNHLGGGDFDLEIAHHFCTENHIDFDKLAPAVQNSLLQQAEQCKMALTEQNTAMMVLIGDETAGSISLTNQKLIEICAPLFQRIASPIRRALTDSKISVQNLDAVIMVGGSSKMPAVRGYLAHLLDRTPEDSRSPDTIVALGAGTYAGMKERRQEIRDILLTDICPFSLGVGVNNPNDPDRPLMSPVIERNSILPSSKIGLYSTVSDYQTEVYIRIFQGEERYCDENIKLGEIRTHVPPMLRGREALTARFTYDINGILEVEVRVLSTGLTEKAVIVGKNNNMSPEEIQKRLAELSKLKIHPRDQEVNRALIARADKLYTQTVGDDREQISHALEWFSHVLANQDPVQIIKARVRFERFVSQMETELYSFGAFPSDDED